MISTSTLWRQLGQLLAITEEGGSEAPSTQLDRPPHPAQADGEAKGAPWVGCSKTRNRPAVKAPAISLPCHWTSRREA